jgi:pimeloyl-ACP methyl ester carboxylesterase
MNVAEHHVEAADGRRLHVLERGAAGGIAVIGHHGTPGSGAVREDHGALALERGARMIVYDRPGYGGSDPHPGRRVADAAADVATIADALGVDRFVTWGVSGGGPHALACAALLGDRVAAAASLASIGPPDASDLDLMEGMGEENVVEFGKALAGRAELEPYLAEMAPQIRASTPAEVAEILRSVLSPPDLEVFDGALADFIVGMFKRGLEPGPEGWIEDDLAFVAPWGFSLDDIAVPVLLLQGEQDLMVPGAHGRWLAGRIPGVDARILPDDGHMTLLTTRMPEILDWMLERL